jgi:heterodisulfide reductase subunit C
VLSRYPIGMAITAVALAIAGHRLYYLFHVVTAGKPAPERLNNWGKKAQVELTEVGGQRKLLKWTVPGLAHAFTFWGFTILLLTIIEAYGDLFDKTFAIPGIGHSAFVGFIEDFFACAVLVSLGVFTVLRLKQSPARQERRSRFFGSHTTAAWITLGLIASVIITLLLYRACQTVTGDFPYGWWAFASHGIGRAFAGLGLSTVRTLETVFVDLNIAVIMGFAVFLVYSKHLHIVMAPFNVAFSRRPRALGPLGSTPNMDPETMSEEDVIGVGRIEQFSWKQLLDFVTCTECGRCQDQCPAWATDKPLSPKLVVMNLRDHLLTQGPNVLANARLAATNASTNGKAGKAEPVDTGALVPDVIEPDVLWSCTTCGACVEQCPVDIEHVDAIVDMRRYEVMMESRFPTEAGTMLRNIENRGDPWGLGSSKRLEWTNGLDFEVPVVNGTIPEDVEYLFWVGCAGALDERACTAPR